MGTEWPTSGVEIEAGKFDNLWVFVEVDDETDEGVWNTLDAFTMTHLRL